LITARVCLFALLCVVAGVGAAKTPAEQSERWQLHAGHVRIVRDNWGIAHVYGQSDADTVFGAMYAQAEDDFDRIERNYLNGLGMLDCSSSPAACNSCIAKVRSGSRH
jgi:acyl-homoserine-lactone acylase